MFQTYMLMLHPTVHYISQDLLATVERFHYQAWPEDIQAMKDYKTGVAPPKPELNAVSRSFQ